MSTILVVEDDLDLREALVDSLVSADYTVHEAANGQAGLKVIQNETPDLILLDLLMPVMNGWEMMQEVEKLPGGTDIPVLVLTNVGMGETQVKQISHNQPTWYLVKADWSLADILEKVKAILDVAE